jgi:hypothetical protein
MGVLINPASTAHREHVVLLLLWRQVLQPGPTAAAAVV